MDIWEQGCILEGANDVNNELELRQIMMIIRKRLLLIIVVVLLATIAAGIYSAFFIEKKYEASTKIIVNQSATQLATGQLDLNQINSNIKMIDTYKEIIKAPAILDKVVEQFPQLGYTAVELSSKIKVSSVNNTQVMTLAVQDISYRKAAETVNAVSDVFQQEIQHNFKIENVSILNKAKLEAQPGPVSPNVKLNIAIAFVVSLMLVVGVVFLLEYMDDTLKTEQDVQEHLGLPTLAMITKLNQGDVENNQPSKAGRTSRANQSYKAGELERVSIEK